MSRPAKNQNLVPANDLPYFLAATVAGLRQQLDDNDLDTSGLKYDLYLRLISNNIRLYTDDRSSSEDDSEGGDNPDDDNSGDDQPGDNQDSNPSVGGGKRRRDDDDDDHDDNDQNPVPPPPPPMPSMPPPPPMPMPPMPPMPSPPRKRVRVGAALPVEVQLTIVDQLNVDQIWNLAMASPEGYLSNDLNVFILEARQQHAIDYPRRIGGDDGGGGDGGSDGGSSGNSDGPPETEIDPNRPLSLLKWVGRRCMYDPEFRVARAAEISQVVDAYLQVYGNADPAIRHNNEIEDMLWYLEDNHPQTIALDMAARYERPDVVRLLLLRGAEVDFSDGFPWVTPLSRAVEQLSVNPDRGADADADLLQCIFALIGAGADVGAVRARAKTAASNYLGSFMQLPMGDEPDYLWRRIINFRQASAREFVADERSDWVERIIVAMYVVRQGEMDYPGFEF